MELRVKDGRRFADALRQAREAAGLSQVKLAALLGVAPRTVQYWEAGKIIPGPRQRVQLAEFLDEAEGEAA
jgi:transcriptional regulator with XRE-family HTH domain